MCLFDKMRRWNWQKCWIVSRFCSLKLWRRPMPRFCYMRIFHSESLRVFLCHHTWFTQLRFVPASMISDTLVAQRPSTLYKYKKRNYKASQGTIQEAGNGGREEE
ncbi:hypothetical protein F2Q70_00030980 [Brassica cretica]|uniref:Uncharacterized protein n=1 Tax=Brassica cretica TaxID=69181 RepID=A0A8S9HAC3_BRACR|nr:hypothetical protein F2Q70_00030980 [Brassica cretica]KAF2553192.1 hypothetical protein F2Q68_00035363 [Brassica cretica]